MMRVMLYAGARVRGGLLAHVSTLAGGLVRSGHQLHVLLSPAPGADPAALECARAGARVTRLEVSGKGDLAGMLRLGRLVRSETPDIFHAHLSSPVEAIPVLMVASRAGARRMVTTEHAPTWHPLERAWSATAKRAAARSLHAVIALCASDARYLATRYALPDELLTVIPNGVALPDPLPSAAQARARMGLPPERARDFLVGYVGALETKKGVLDLLEAARLQEPAMTLWLAGEGSLRPELAARGAGAPFGLLMPGHVDPVGLFLPALNLFVLPSHQEAMPLALLEAMAAGLPIVATRVGGIPEALEEGEAGLLVEPGRPGDLAEAIRRLRVDAALRERLGSRAAARAASLYTSSRMAAGVSDLYRRLLLAGDVAPAEGAR